MLYLKMASKKSQFLAKQQEDESDPNINPFEQPQSQSPKKHQKIKTTKIKKDKNSKKEKKSKKSKKKSREEEEDEDYEDEINSMFDEEAESGDEEEEELDEEAEVGFEEERQRFAELYNRPNATQRLLEKLEGKNEREINAQYSKKANAIRSVQHLYPSDKDPKLYAVLVKTHSEDELALKILNKARHLASTPNKVKITAVLSLKRRYPGKIFVQAFSEADIRESLDGFNDIYLGKKIEELGQGQYEALFAKEVEQRSEFKEGAFVRVKKGLYEGDLAKVLKVKKNTVDVVLVPRIDIPQIRRKIKQKTDTMVGQQMQAACKAKKQQILKLFINHKQKNYKERPSKRQLFEQDFASLQDIPGVSAIRIANINGLIVLTYNPDELEKVYGSYLPVQILPFTTQGKFIQELKDDIQNLATSVSFKKGEEVQIVAGELEKHYGVLKDIRGNIGIIECRNKELKGELLEEPLAHIAKRFKIGQRVKITSGTDSGKTGIIITLQPKYTQIWTDNSNSLKISKRNIELFHGETICNENIHNIKKHDLIKATKNMIGIVIETTMDSIKIVNTDGVMQVIGNLDFCEKVRGGYLVAVNQCGEEIRQDSVVVVKEGVNRLRKCQVVRVYMQWLFLFNQGFNRTGGIAVESVDNCSLIAKHNMGKVQLSTWDNKNKDETCNEEEITVGMMMTIKTGGLKGYKGMVKSIQKDRIQVRVLSKGVTEWVPRRALPPKHSNPDDDEAGKTPSRIYGSFKGFSQSEPMNDQ